MKLPSSKLKKFLFLGDHLRVFHHCFLTCFHILPPFFYYCFRVFLLLIVFIHFTNFRVFHHCFLGVFISPLVFIIVFWVFSFCQVSLPWLFFCQVLRFCVAVPRVLRYERAFFPSGVFYFTLLPTFATVPWVLTIWESIFYSQAFFILISFPTFGTTCFYQGFSWSDSFSLKVAGPSTEVRNTDSTHLFVWITPCSAKGISR